MTFLKVFGFQKRKMENFIVVRCILALIISGGLALHGLKKKSLDISGAIGAVLVGFFSIASSYRFGAILIVCYYTSSKLTKIREDVKAKIESDYQLGGQRNIIQVFANSIIATIVCLIYYFYFGEDSDPSFVCSANFGFSSTTFWTSNFSGILWCLYVAHYACATADTWASELGVLAVRPPRLVTSLFLREVPTGTNGGMSLLGTAASAGGGVAIGVTFWLLSFFVSGNIMLQFPMVIVGLVSGVLGSLYDSILGATVQASYYSTERKCIVKRHEKAKDKSIIVVSGADILTNEAVNLVSIVMTMITMAYLGPYIYCALSV